MIHTTHRDFIIIVGIIIVSPVAVYFGSSSRGDGHRVLSTVTTRQWTFSIPSGPCKLSGGAGVANASRALQISNAECACAACGRLDTGGARPVCALLSHRFTHLQLDSSGVCTALPTTCCSRRSSSSFCRSVATGRCYCSS